MNDADGLVHQALVYSDRDEFVTAMLPFVRDGLERGDRVFAATSPENIEALRDELGAVADGLDFQDAADWYRQPYRTLAAYARYLEEHANGNVVRVIGEPVWSGRTASSIREWARYESALNVTFAPLRAWIVCPYDASSLPEDVLRHAFCTHPEVLLGRHGPRASHNFLPHDRFLDLLSAQEVTLASRDAIELRLQGDDYADIRRQIARHASRAGLPQARVHELVIALNELVTNAARHGRRPVVVRIWREPEDVVFEVEDGGRGFSDPTAGCMPPTLNAASGRGLWLVRQLCDSMIVVRRRHRFAVQVRAMRERAGEPFL